MALRFVCLCAAVWIRRKGNVLPVQIFPEAGQDQFLGEFYLLAEDARI